MTDLIQHKKGAWGIEMVRHTSTHVCMGAAVPVLQTWPVESHFKIPFIFFSKYDWEFLQVPGVFGRLILPCESRSGPTSRLQHGPC